MLLGTTSRTPDRQIVTPIANVAGDDRHLDGRARVRGLLDGARANRPVARSSAIIAAVRGFDHASADDQRLNIYPTASDCHAITITVSVSVSVSFTNGDIEPNSGANPNRNTDPADRDPGTRTGAGGANAASDR